MSDNDRVPCPYCSRLFKARGLHNHISTYHPERYEEYMARKAGAP